MPEKSRASLTWGDKYDSAEDFVFERSIHSVNAYFYDTDGKFVARFTTLSEPTEKNGWSFIVGTDGLDNKIVPGADGVRRISGKLIIIANCENSAGNGLGTVRFGQPASEAPSDWDEAMKTQIPMWGCCTLTDIPVSTYQGSTPPSVSENAIEIHLLRAMAKITVTLSAQARAIYQLTGVALSHCAESGNAVPSGASEVATTLDLEIDNCFNPATDALTDTKYNLTPHTYKIKDDNGNEVTVTDFIGYVPEIANSGRANFFMTADIVDNNGIPLITGENDLKIYFTEYVDGEPAATGDGRDFDIVRNHSYLFTIDGVTAPAVNYTVCRWTDYISGDIYFN